MRKGAAAATEKTPTAIWISDALISMAKNWHSGYFPWIHGKFLWKGKGKWSRTGILSYRSYGSEVMGLPYEQARRLPRHPGGPLPSADNGITIRELCIV